MIPVFLTLFIACGDSEPQKVESKPAEKPTAPAQVEPPPQKVEVPVQATPSAEAAPAGTADGQAVYTKVCQQCHQATGQGIPTLYPPLAGSDWLKKDPEVLARIVLHGLQGPIKVNGQDYNQAMTPQGTILSDEEIASALTYVRSSWGNAEAAITAEQVTSTREKYKDRTTQWTAEELESN